MLKNAIFVVRGFYKNSIFNLSHVHNRDDSCYPYYLMREAFKEYGIEINTQDVRVSNEISFELHMDANSNRTSAPCYLLMLETTQVCPYNGDIPNLDKYRKVFTWDDNLVDGQRFIKINFPNLISMHKPDGFVGRPSLCVMIAGNKSLLSKDTNVLYGERVKDIRWFEKNAPHDFALYGVDWDIPLLKANTLGKIQRRVWRLVSRFRKVNIFPSYRGKLTCKKYVLMRSRYVICYENVKDSPGYITEKIFDAFFSGCVPIYWGAKNITEYIPEGTFIDRRLFVNTAEMYEYIKGISEDEYIGYQNKILQFLSSERSNQFSYDYFVNTIVETIAADL